MSEVATCAFSQVCAPGHAPWYLPLHIDASKFAHVHDPYGLVWAYVLAYIPLKAPWSVHTLASVCICLLLVTATL